LHSYAEAKGLVVVNVYYIAEWFLANMQALQGIDRLVPLFFSASAVPLGGAWRGRAAQAFGGGYGDCASTEFR